jgi:hemerythrin-like metal-binding protein
MSNQFEIFPWTENFATGIEQIDQQHKRLVQLLNALVSQLAFQADGPQLETVFEELKNYTVEHFQSEQEIWAQHFKGDPWESWHADAHGDFIAAVHRFLGQESSKPIEILLEEIVSYLTHWLALHIIESDKRMAKVVLALPTGVSLERAKELANLEMSGSTRVLIDTVMGMYDKLANRTVHLTREINLRIKAEIELRATRDALLRAKDEAVAATLAKSRFLAVMSHELRTPLNSVLGLAQVGLNENPDENPKELFSRIHKAGMHLLLVANDILDFSKIEEDKLKIEIQTFDLKVLIEEVEDAIKESARIKSLPVNIEYTDPVPQWVSGDSLRLKQVLLNLMSNAIKFTSHGNVVLRISKSGENCFRFEIQDSGIGISPNQLESLFSAFEQGDASVARLYGGTGLGLTISQRLAQLMAGNISVVSEVGTGSVFTLTIVLPETDAPREAIVPHTENRVQFRLNGLRILVADDVEPNRYTITRLLISEGAKVDFVCNGQEALDRVSDPRNAQYDLILMDVEMPLMNGLESTRRIKAISPKIPVIGLTAHALQQELEAGLQAGMDSQITKPAHLDDLVREILRFVNKKTQSVLATDDLRPSTERIGTNATINESGNLVNLAAVAHYVGTNSDEQQNFIRLAAKTIASSLPEMDRCASVGDMNAVAILAHGLRSLSVTLGATRFTEICRELEGWRSSGGDIENTKVKIRELSILFDASEIVKEARKPDD